MDDLKENCKCDINLESKIEAGIKATSDSKNEKQNKKIKHNSRNALHYVNEISAGCYLRHEKEIEEVICTKDVIIAMLQEQMKKFEKNFKKTLDEMHLLKYKYCSTTQQLINLKKIYKKCEEENVKLLEEKKKIKQYENERYENEILLQNEAEKWKKQYEELLRKIENVEKETAVMNNLLETESYISADNNTTVKTEPADILKAIQIQNEKMDLIHNELLSLKLDKQRFQNILNQTEECLLRVKKEAEKVRKISENVSHQSMELLWEENVTLKMKLDMVLNNTGTQSDETGIITKKDDVATDPAFSEDDHNKDILIEQLYSKIQEQEDNIENLKQLISETEEKDGKKIEALLTEKKWSEDNEKELLKKIKNLDNDVVAKSHTINDLELKLLNISNKLAEEVKNHESLITEEDMLLASLQQYQTEKEQLAELLNNLEIQVAERDNKIMILKNENDELYKKISSLEFQLEQMKSEVNEKNTEIFKYKTNYKNMEMQMSELQINFQREKNSIDSIRELSNSQLTQALKKNSETTKEISKITKEAEELKSSNKVLSTKLQALTKKIVMNSEEITALEQILTELDANFVEIRNNYFCLNMEYTNLQTNWLNKNREIEKLDVLLRSQTEKFEDTKCKLNCLQTLYDKQLEENKQLQQNYNATISKMDDLNSLIEILENENKDIKNKLENLIVSLENKIGFINKDIPESELINIESKESQNSSAPKEKTTQNDLVGKNRDQFKKTKCVNRNSMNEDELKIKRRYMLNRILSIEKELNDISRNRLKLSRSKSLSDVNIVESFKKIYSSSLGSNKNSILIDKPKCQTGCNHLQNTSSHSKSKAYVIPSNCSSECLKNSLHGKILDLEKQISVTTEIERHIDQLHNDLTLQHSQMLDNIGANIPVEFFLLHDDENKMKFRRDLSMKSSSESYLITQSEHSDNLPPHPIIQICYSPCSIDSLPHTSIINTHCRDLGQIKGQKK